MKDLNLSVSLARTTISEKVNVMAGTNSSGNAYALYTMDAFGNVLEKGDGGYLYEHSTDPQPYHLTTKEYDLDSQLYYFSARWYDPWSGRFISRDPVGPMKPHGDCPPGGDCSDQAWGRFVRDTFPRAHQGHAYVYVKNQPTVRVDPAGEREMLVPPIIVIIIGGAVLILGGTSCKKAKKAKRVKEWMDICRKMDPEHPKAICQENAECVACCAKYTGQTAVSQPNTEYVACMTHCYATFGLDYHNP